MAVEGSLTVENKANETLYVADITFFDDVAKHEGIKKGDIIPLEGKLTLTMSNDSVLFAPKGIGVRLTLKGQHDSANHSITLQLEIPAVGPHTLETLDKNAIQASYSPPSSPNNSYTATLSSMNQFELFIQIPQRYLSKLMSDGKELAILKSPNFNNVLWTTIAPLEANNFSWHRDIGIYASYSHYQLNDSITPSIIKTPAAPGFEYDFDGVFSAPKKHPVSNEYQFKNETAQTVTFGLAHTLTGNQQSFENIPITGKPIAKKSSLTVVSLEEILVFLYPKTAPGTPIERSEIIGLKLNMDETPVQTIHYDGSKLTIGALE